MTTTVALGRVRWSHGISYDRSMLEYKVIKFPPWMFSTMSNSAIGRKTHTPDSHRWQPLPWFYLLRRQLWTIQAAAGATVEWHQWWQWSNRSSVGRVRWSHGLSYNQSMLEYKVIKFPPWLFSTMSNSTIGRKTHMPDSHRWKPLPWLCLLRQRPWTIKATAGASVEWQQEQQRSNNRSVGRVRWSRGLIYDRSMLEYKVIKFPPWLFSTVPNSDIGRKTQKPDSHWWQPLPWFCLLRQQPWIIQATEGATVGAKAGVTA